MDPTDKGIRKYRIALTTMALISCAYAACHWSHSLERVFEEYCMAVIGAASVFSGSNVLEKLRRQPPAS